MRSKKLLAGFLATFLMALSLPGLAFAATSTLVVSPSDTKGWTFNPDPANATPYEFTEDKSSIGNGSLYVKPIGATPAHKFIAAKTLNIPVSEVSSFAYDFLIAGNGDSADANQFYLNVYTNLPGSSTYFDCRFDYVPTTGSTTNFTTASFNATSTPTTVAPRGTATCPTTLAGMPSGSKVSFFTLNVGDTSNSDTGLAGYFDKVVVNASGNTTKYDFELRDVPTTKDQCKNNGYKNYVNDKGEDFKNQGQCIKFVEHHAVKIKGNNVRYNAFGLDRRAEFEMNTGDNNGHFEYSDDNGDWYKVKVSEVKADGNFGYFAGEVKKASNPAWVGQWLFAKVEDNDPDKIWGDFTNETAAKQGVKNKTSPASGPFNVTRGHIRVRD